MMQQREITLQHLHAWCVSTVQTFMVYNCNTIARFKHSSSTR